MHHHTTTHRGCDAAIPTVCFGHSEASSTVTPLAFHAPRIFLCSHWSSLQMCCPDHQLLVLLPPTHKGLLFSHCLVSLAFNSLDESRCRCPAHPPSYGSKIFKALSAFPVPCSSLISCCSAESKHLLSALPGIFSHMSEHKSHP